MADKQKGTEALLKACGEEIVENGSIGPCRDLNSRLPSPRLSALL